MNSNYLCTCTNELGKIIDYLYLLQIRLLPVCSVLLVSGTDLSDFNNLHCEAFLCNIFKHLAGDWEIQQRVTNHRSLQCRRRPFSPSSLH